MKAHFAGTRVTVMGLGRFGGGAGVADWLAMEGAKVIVTDMAHETALQKSIDSLRPWVDSGVMQLHLGSHHEPDFTHTDCVIANPAVRQPWQNAYLLAARSAGVPITTEIRLVVERLRRGRVIGVTGTAGKSTTSAMIHHILTSCGLRSHLGGNIGGSLLGSLERIAPDDWVVMELSSAMLWWLAAEAGAWDDRGGVIRGGWSPSVAVLTNIEPNHIDWHASFDHYVACKENIARYQTRGDVQVRDVMMDSTMPPLPLRIPGRHNQLNARFAIEAVRRSTGHSTEKCVRAIQTFGGLPHRLQFVAESNGLQFFNDSKSTTPAATVLAVQSFDTASRVHLIAGGYDKGVDMSAISRLATQVAGLYTIGATGPRLREVAGSSNDHVVFCETLERAIERAMSRMKEGDVMLLSPGCASWDQFENFEARGEKFVAVVRASLGKGSSGLTATEMRVESKLPTVLGGTSQPRDSQISLGQV